MSTVADRILDVIAAAGATHIFGVPGDAINHIVDALADRTDLTFVHVRHEEFGALAASAQAKLTGRLSVCLGTAGPGAIHLLNGLYDAKLDGAPVLALTGQVAAPQRFTGGHQEIDQTSLFGAATAFTATITDPEQALGATSEACRVALHRRQPTHIAVSADVVGESAPDSALSAMPPRSMPVPPESALIEAAELLDAHDDIVLLIGGGARHATEAIEALAAHLHAPIVASLKGKEVLPDDHSHLIGGLGLLGTRPGVEAMASADALVMIGTDFPYADFYPDPPVPTVQIDIDATRIGRRCPVTVGLVGDSDSTVRTLIHRTTAKTDVSRLRELQESKREWLEDLAVAETDDSLPLRPQRLAKAVSDAAPDDTIFCVDTGAVTVWSARNLHLRAGQRLTLSGQLASMGYGIPAAIGAQLAHPGRSVVAMVGDGSFTMALPSLLTAVDLALPITCVVFDNAKLGLIQVEQEAEGLAENRTDLDNPDLAAVARSMGAAAFTVDEADELAPTLQKAFATNEPTVVHVHVSGQELTVPPSMTVEDVAGFVKAKAKEFLGGNDGVSGVEALVAPLRGGPLNP